MSLLTWNPCHIDWALYVLEMCSLSPFEGGVVPVSHGFSCVFKCKQNKTLRHGTWKGKAT